jgi:hypothetical protein
MWAAPVISRMFRAGICTEMERQSCLSCDGDGRQRGPQRPGGRVRLEQER